MMAAFAASKPPRIHPGSPEWRAALFGQAIAYAAHLTGPICPHALGRHLWAFVGQAEVECGGECLDAVLILIQTGLFTANTMDEDTGAITFCSETKLTVAPMLTAYVYGGPVECAEDEA
ncbi:hypothetical protein G3T14_21435 [Methylobacterium sp. BTF04]|uniref:hypothetical protein n=1 Tax=Methylobacterium sp. BTF04 TaxID=2708300 RepID=UPI0013D4AEBF|nr:hypothetical protein [Methylobacterium sp. BTF04]NEU14650.1 hypothetical protein [Methylobacterium sp. BTF04]